MKLLFLLSFLLCAILAAATQYACPACPENYMPVCGSDGRTYSNECVLECTVAPSVRVASYGECQE